MKIDGNIGNNLHDVPAQAVREALGDAQMSAHLGSEQGAQRGVDAVAPPGCPAEA